MRGTDRRLRRLALAGLAGPLVFWVLVFVNGTITPGYRHVADFISTLGAVGAPYAIVQQVNFVVFGASTAAFAVGIHRWFDDGSRPRAGTILLGVFALGIILSGPFQATQAAPESITNVLHDLAAGVAFLSGIVAITLVSRRFVADERWPNHRFELILTVLIVVGTFVVFISTIESAWVGLTQRLFIGALSLWVAGQSYRLYRLAGMPEWAD